MGDLPFCPEVTIEHKMRLEHLWNLIRTLKKVLVATSRSSRTFMDRQALRHGVGTISTASLVNQNLHLDEVGS